MGEQHLGELGHGERFPLDTVRLLEPVEVAALFDFGLTPRHLKNSAEVLMKYEKDNPQTAPLLQAFARAIMGPRSESPPGRPESLSYYKCNMNSIVGDGETVGQVKYRGSTSEISHKAEDVFAWLQFIGPLASGSVIGFGTTPDCTGCDHDDFIDPGADIRITIEKLGTLHCRFAEPAGKLLPSRWPLREPLLKYGG